MFSRYKKLLLTDALLEDYPDELITGYIVDALIRCESVLGLIYKGWGYRNGESFVSATISEVVLYEGPRWLIKTIERDCFVIVNFHTRGGRQSLLYLTDLLNSAALAGSSYCWH